MEAVIVRSKINESIVFSNALIVDSSLFWKIQSDDFPMEGTLGYNVMDYEVGVIPPSDRSGNIVFESRDADEILYFMAVRPAGNSVKIELTLWGSEVGFNRLETVLDGSGNMKIIHDYSTRCKPSCAEDKVHGHDVWDWSGSSYVKS